ncbi:penicillin-binding transpeptidase domain-containing protein, partial [Eubacteriales bacterium DFI.9.88]|nr:penicillin-binding transpeptidase domain-containing protein [Eubacteriales bacterium DFI.9.88]
VSALADLCKYTYINQSTWNTGDALNIAIGQGIKSYTPLQMAGYVAALGNKGVRNQISLVEMIEGRGTIE